MITLIQKAVELLHVTLTLKRDDAGHIVSIDVRHTLNGWLVLLLTLAVVRLLGLNVGAVGELVKWFTQVRMPELTKMGLDIVSMFV